MRDDADNSKGENPTGNDAGGITLLTVIGSVFSSFFGVQSNKNRQRDFSSGKFWHFFVAGVLFVLVLLALIFGLVQYLLATAPGV